MVSTQFPCFLQQFERKLPVGGHEDEGDRRVGQRVQAAQQQGGVAGRLADGNVQGDGHGHPDDGHAEENDGQAELDEKEILKIYF